MEKILYYDYHKNQIIISRVIVDIRSLKLDDQGGCEIKLFLNTKFHTFDDKRKCILLVDGIFQHVECMGFMRTLCPLIPKKEDF